MAEQETKVVEPEVEGQVDPSVQELIAEFNQVFENNQELILERASHGVATVFVSEDTRAVFFVELGEDGKLNYKAHRSDIFHIDPKGAIVQPKKKGSRRKPGGSNS